MLTCEPVKDRGEAYAVLGFLPSTDLFWARIRFGRGSILGADLFWAQIYFGRGFILGEDLFRAGCTSEREFVPTWCIF